MLQQVCEYLLNYFIEDTKDGVYTITSGVFSPALDLKNGQRFLVSGSSMNDGVYTYTGNGIKTDDANAAAVLKDETFTGSISAMAVPPLVAALAIEIGQWCTEYAGALDTPYQSENVIGVYSYTKQNGDGRYGSGFVTWQSKFGSKLKRWKRISL